MVGKRILLVNPPARFLIDERVFLPLGLASVAAVAKREGHQIALLDLAGSDDPKEEIRGILNRFKPDLVGVTSTSPQFTYAYQTLKRIKSIAPELRVMIGGPHASMLSELRKKLILKHKGISGDKLDQLLRSEEVNFRAIEEFDVIVQGEEEGIVRAMESDKKWIDVGVTNDLDPLPLPSRHLFDESSYLYDGQGKPKFSLVPGEPTGSLITQRGCPYKCEFCSGRGTNQYGKIRKQSPSRVLLELDEMNDRLGLTSFMFYNDEFFLSPSYTRELCDELKLRDYRFRGFVRSDLIVKNPDMVDKLREAGFVELLVGIESGSERILNESLTKGNNTKINSEATRMIVDGGIRCKTLTMLGHVGERLEDILKTRDWLIQTGGECQKKSRGSFTFDLSLFQPFPGSPIWDNSERNYGDFSDGFDRIYFHKTDKDPNFVLYFRKPDFSKEAAFYKGKPGEYHSTIRTPEVDPQTFERMRDEIEEEARAVLK